jgi:hypothetical protein
MIELIILGRYCGKIGREAREKGRKAIGYQLLLIFFWFFGEMIGAVTTGVVLALLFGDKMEQYLLLAYIPALMGAALGAWIAFQLVRSLPDPRVEPVQDPGDPQISIS